MRMYDLRISLIESGPEIWRRVRVSGDIRLKKLHWIIQAVMGWTNSHLHQFVVGHVCYSDPSFELERHGDEIIEDESRVPLRKVLPFPNSVLVYEYDFGDSWHHLVRVECVSARGPNEPTHPVCTGGQRACPPEDCGGLHGFYEQFLPAMLDPAHEEHQSMREWFGGDFDPETFDLNAVNAALKRL